MSYAHAMRPGGGYGSEASAESLHRLKDLGVTWVSITPFAFQRHAQDTTFRWFRGESEYEDAVRDLHEEPPTPEAPATANG